MRSKIALQIAGLLHIASPTGDCWALTAYYHSVGDLHSNMTDLCRQWLVKAQACSLDTRDRAVAYYALLMLPIDDNTLPTSKDWDDKWEYNLNNPQLLTAMNWLRSNRYADGMPDYITGCDGIKYYGF